MIDGGQPSNRFLHRIRQELEKLPLTEEQRYIIAHRILKDGTFLDKRGGRIPSGGLEPDSPVFSFAEKIQAILDRFEEHGLTAKDYLAAVIRRPELLSYKPDALAANIDGVVDLFAADGLVTEKYLKAAIKQPSLFLQSPWTLSGNITGLVVRFAAEGLNDRAYLDAAIKHPSLFTMYPRTIEYNIRSVVERFEEDGMTTQKYLKAALTTPALLALSPETVIRHIETVIEFSDRGLFIPPKRRDGCDKPDLTSNRNHARVIDFLLSNPRFLTFADDNYGVREVHQRLTDGPTDGRFLQRARYTVERDLMQHLGHDDPQRPVPTDGFVAGAATPTEEQAKRLILRALIRAGFIRSGSIER
jgi:hypothetical protein